MPGSYRHRITIKGPNPTRDASGQEVDAWDTIIVRDLPASVEDIGGGESKRGMQVEAGIVAVVKFHHPQGAFTVSPQQRIHTTDGRVLNIDRVTVDSTGQRDMVCLCKELVT